MGIRYVGLALALGLLQPLGAASIIYIETGQLSGTLGSSALNDAAFTFTLIGDTANITGAGTAMSPFLNTAISNTFAIGASQGFFSSAVDAGADGVDAQVGLTSSALTAGITFNSAGATGYNLATAISVSASSPFFASGSFATNLGTLAITGAQNLTFTAIVVPEPATGVLSAFTLLGFALLGVRTARKRFGERQA
jgi:hypothetical protein